MPADLSIPATVLLAGADGAAVASLRPAAEVLAAFGIGSEVVIVAANEAAAAKMSPCRAIIVASSDAALPSALAACTDLPVIRVPTEGDGRGGAGLLNDGAGNLPAGPENGVFATMAIGLAGAKNAALFVVAALAGEDERLREAWAKFRADQTDAVLRHPTLTTEDEAS